MSEILGLGSLQANMERLARDIDGGDLENGFLEIGKMLKDRLKENTPVGKSVKKKKRRILFQGIQVGEEEINMRGALKKSWRAKKFKGKKPGSPAVFVAMDRKVAAYGSNVEFGHGGPHPAPAHPFVRPVVDNFKNEYPLRVAMMIREKFGKNLTPSE